MDEASEKVAVELAAQGVIGKRVDEMESGFMMALDHMIQVAEKDQDDLVILYCYTWFLCSFLDCSVSFYNCIMFKFCQICLNHKFDFKSFESSIIGHWKILRRFSNSLKLTQIGSLSSWRVGVLFGFGCWTFSC